MFNDKEYDEETGNYYYSARYYDPKLSIFISVDPLADIQPNKTPYHYCSNNPINRTDPSGMLDGDFIDENGKYLGNDGINDNKVYVIKTTQKRFDTGVSSAGISKSDAKATENFIKSNSGNKEAFENNSIAYDNSVEIVGSTSTRQSMYDIVSQDDGRGGVKDANNREYGGLIDVNNNVSQSTPSEVVNHSEVSAISFGLNPDDDTKSTFHSHPSGFTESGTKSGGNTIGYETYRKNTFGQAPSLINLNNSRHDVNYVFGRGDDKVYIYIIQKEL